MAMAEIEDDGKPGMLEREASLELQRSVHGRRKERLEKQNPVKVAVRCRPMNHRERQQGLPQVVTVQDGAVVVRSTRGRGQVRLPFDYCYGPETKQDRVNADIGDCVAKNACSGYNSVVFAYGKTGSGKTFTMTQLIAYVLDLLLAKVASPETKTFGAPSYKLEAYYFEIYNEEIYDLWNSGGRKKVTRPMFVNPKTGYVDLGGLGLTKMEIKSMDEIEHLLAVGLAARTVSSTKLNAHSSRSHAILRLEFTCTEYEYRESDEDCCKAVDTFSCHDLVDLAGSENTRASGVKGVNHTEAGKINQSLVTLQRVIEALSKVSKKQRRDPAQVFVPYRDSKLTHLLKPSLGGNAKAFMIAAVSPADEQATSSTLDYARKCAQVVNHPKVNKDENENALNEWKVKVEELSRKLRLTQAQLDDQKGESNPREVRAQLEQRDERIAELEQELRREKVANELKTMELEEIRSRSQSAMRTCSDLKAKLDEEAQRKQDAEAQAEFNKANIEHFKTVNQALCGAIDKLQAVAPDAQKLQITVQESPERQRAERAMQEFTTTLDAVAREKDFVRQVAARHIEFLEKRLAHAEDAREHAFQLTMEHVSGAADQMERLQCTVDSAKDRLSQAFEATDRGEISIEDLQETMATSVTVMFVVSEKLCGTMGDQLDKLRRRVSSLMKPPADTLVSSPCTDVAWKQTLVGPSAADTTVYFSDDEDDEEETDLRRLRGRTMLSDISEECSSGTKTPTTTEEPLISSNRNEDADMLNISQISSFLQGMEEKAQSDLLDLGLDDLGSQHQHIIATEKTKKQEQPPLQAPLEVDGFRTPLASPRVA